MPVLKLIKGTSFQWGIKHLFCINFCHFSQFYSWFSTLAVTMFQLVLEH